MKNSICYLFSLISFVLFVSCNNQDVKCEDLKKGDVCITIKNRSKSKISKLTITHERGEREISNLLNGDDVNVIFNSPGESSYKIIINFENGKTLESSEAYIEGGYRMIETINSNKIKTETHISRLY